MSLIYIIDPVFEVSAAQISQILSDYKTSGGLPPKNIPELI
jgi:hypothetical protein